MNVNRNVSPSSTLQRKNPAVASTPPRAEAPPEHEGLKGLYKPDVIRLDPADAERLDDVMQKVKKWDLKHADGTGRALLVGEISLSLSKDRKMGFEYTYKPSKGPAACNLEEAGVESSTLIAFAQSALDRSGQMVYLLKHRDALVNEDYCLGLQIILKGALDVSKASGFHQDGAEKGAQLFTNLFYDTDLSIDGPEYIVNPETLGDRIDNLKGKVPSVVVQHLRDVHATQHGEVVHKSQVQRGDMLSFTNLAIYHKTPDPKSRGVDLTDLQASLPKWLQKYGMDDWAESYQRCARLLACEDASAGLSPDDLEFMAKVDKQVIGFAQFIRGARGWSWKRSISRTSCRPGCALTMPAIFWKSLERSRGMWSPWMKAGILSSIP
ncbi:hypothetical protein [Variovorax sp. WS11]|uniref:hypothetical protein n=1 Tax=Variovorax sp. WS11 TaxID=1105204 RepID=UPI0011B26BF2|nr:hypothetical protein [Variovorax sp. WS11]NDZ16681.1 hypothetical protein [Variovorax sp. WS11]